jgi:uncharacterized protein (TIGR00369 family)
MAEEIDFERELAEIGRPSGFRSLLGYTTIEWREGYGEILLRLEAKHMNARMIPHGGLYMAVLDSAMGHAATYCPVPGNHRRCVTIGFQTNFLAPAEGAYLRACARLVSSENRIAVCQGEVIDALGKQCVAALGSFRYMRDSENLEGVPLPSA